MVCDGWGKDQKYFVSRLLLLIMSIIVMIIAIALYFGDSNVSGAVIANEVTEWNKGAIIDIQPSVYSKSAQCPDGYETVLGKFYGTKSFCKHSPTNIEIGQCTGGGQLVYGLLETQIASFNTSMLCVKRSANNYHTYVNQRNTDCSSQKCGDPSNPEKQFCMSECPLNAIDFLYRSNVTDISYNYTKYEGRNYSNFWLLNQVSDFSGHNPLVSFHISLSQPCGDIQDSYVKRPVTINKIFQDVDSCHFDYNNQQHDGYFDSGFSNKELYTLRENFIEQQFQNYIGPTYDQTELLKNDYKIYFKGYALYKSSCQSTYSTQQVTEQGENIQDFNQVAYAVYITTILTVIFEAIFLILYIQKFCVGKSCRDQGKCSEKTYKKSFKCIKYFFCIVKLCLAFIIFVEFLAFIAALNKVSITITGYVEENKCSDDIVTYALSVFNTGHRKNLVSTGVGIGFSLISLILQVLFTIYTTKKISKFCCKGNKLKHKDKKTNQEEIPKDPEAKYLENAHQYDKVGDQSMTDNGPGHVYNQQSPENNYYGSSPVYQEEPHKVLAYNLGNNQLNPNANGVDESVEQLDHNNDAIVFQQQDGVLNQQKTFGRFNQASNPYVVNDESDFVSNDEIKIENDDDKSYNYQIKENNNNDYPSEGENIQD